MSRDPVEDLGALSLYAMLGNNNVNATDYLGWCLTWNVTFVYPKTGPSLNSLKTVAEHVNWLSAKYGVCVEYTHEEVKDSYVDAKYVTLPWDLTIGTALGVSIKNHHANLD